VQGGEGLIAELVRVEKEGGRISAREMARWFSCCWAQVSRPPRTSSADRPRADEKPGPPRLARRGLEPRHLAIENSCGSFRPCSSPKPRIARKDVDLGGVRVNKGDRSCPCWRQPTWTPPRTSHPERLNLERSPTGISLWERVSTFVSATSLQRIEGRCALQACFRAGQTRNGGAGSEIDAPTAGFQGDCSCPCWCALNSYS